MLAVLANWGELEKQKKCATHNRIGKKPTRCVEPQLNTRLGIPRLPVSGRKRESALVFSFFLPTWLGPT